MRLDDYLRRGVAPPPDLRVLGRALYGVLSFNLGDRCNYRCSYCTQRFQRDRSRALTAPGPALDALAALPGVWEVKLSGGEPFEQPALLSLVSELARRGHVVSVQTNFSASDQSIRAFLEATRGALHLFSASLHLDYATPQRFIERYRALLVPYEAHGLRFHVTSVATRERLPQLHDEVAPLLRDAGIVFKVQPEKDHGALRAHTDDELQQILALGGHNLTGEVAPCFRGRLCHAGSRYLVIKSDGSAYRCYAASRAGGRYARLGSLSEGLSLHDGPRLCTYSHCVCTVPIHRGMVDGVRPARRELGG